MVPDKRYPFEKVTHDAAASLVRRLGWGNDFSIEPLHGGANNQVFLLRTAQQKAVLKAYFQHPQDHRDRLGAEFGFGSFTWNHGIRTLPRPLIKDAENKLAVYSFVGGRSLEADEVNAGRVDEAIAFFAEVNRHRSAPDSKELPLASEAFFSIEQHVAGVSRRIDALGAFVFESDVDHDAHKFVARELIPAWLEVQASLANMTSDAQQSERCLSPSDFGFHNALLTGEGNLTFLDFEYAGWDDPAKTICDFFCQPKIPVSMIFYDVFANAIAAIANAPEKTRARADRLFPLYQLKWCCILLNEFLPVDQKRRYFASMALDREQHKIQQLKKARNMFARLRLGGMKK
jgi:hypothetical protein